jgi:hypothetical protein
MEKLVSLTGSIPQKPATEGNKPAKLKAIVGRA